MARAHLLGLVVAVALGAGVYASAASADGPDVNSNNHRMPENAWIAFSGKPLSGVLAQARKAAACARRHGIRHLKSPTVSGGIVYLMVPRGLQRNAPRLRKAQRACPKFMPAPPSGDDDGPSKTGKS